MLSVPRPCTSVSQALGLLKDAMRSRLFLMTTFSALTGQVSLLAAGGQLASPAVVVTVGLTVIAGVGAFLMAVEEVDLRSRAGRHRFGATALLSVAVNAAAALLGGVLGTTVQLDVVRYFAALALALIAYEIVQQESLQLPLGVPAPLALALLGVGAELLW